MGPEQHRQPASCSPHSRPHTSQGRPSVGLFQVCTSQPAAVGRPGGHGRECALGDPQYTYPLLPMQCGCSRSHWHLYTQVCTERKRTGMRKRWGDREMDGVGGMIRETEKRGAEGRKEGREWGPG